MKRTQKQVSPAQLAANRANAPRNSLKHAFTASTFTVVRLEDLQEIALLKSDLVSTYLPVNSQELIALAQ